MNPASDLNDLQQHLGLLFQQPGLLRQALTHRSYVNEQSSKGLQDNERMEFLGDAVLDFVSGDLLYQLYPNKSEGELTRLRSAIVRTEALAELATQLQLGDYLLMGKGEDNSGGRTRPSILASTFEAVVGAIYLDRGMTAVQDFVTPQFRRYLSQVEEDAIDKDARSRLQEWSQAELGITPVYQTQASLGPDHNKEFIVQVQIGEQFTAVGKGRSKQSASQNAAQTALDMINTGQAPGR
jgi:ribonuclease III